LKVHFVGPKDPCFILGRYTPTPFGVFAGCFKASYDPEIDVLDCQAESLGRDGLERRFGEECLRYKKSTPMLQPRPDAILEWIVGLLAGRGGTS
jgi:hypothetical protein